MKNEDFSNNINYWKVKGINLEMIFPNTDNIPDKVWIELLGCSYSLYRKMKAINIKDSRQVKPISLI